MGQKNPPTGIFFQRIHNQFLATICNSCSRGPNTLFWSTKHVCGTQTHRQNIHIHKVKTFSRYISQHTIQSRWNCEGLVSVLPLIILATVNSFVFSVSQFPLVIGSPLASTHVQKKEIANSP